MLKKFSLKCLEQAMNLALSLDEQTTNKIQALHHKVLQLTVRPLDIIFFIRFSNQTIQLLDEYTGRVDTLIHSSPLGLIRLSLLPASQARSLFNDQIQISGDLLLGQEVKRLFDGLDIDWEGHLARFTGDIIAYHMGSLVRSGRQMHHHLAQSLQQNMTEYLQEERRVFPSRNELEAFYQEVDLLSLAVERLKARFSQWTTA